MDCGYAVEPLGEAVLTGTTIYIFLAEIREIMYTL